MRMSAKSFRVSLSIQNQKKYRLFFLKNSNSKKFTECKDKTEACNFCCETRKNYPWLAAVIVYSKAIDYLKIIWLIQSLHRVLSGEWCGPEMMMVCPGNITPEESRNASLEDLDK